MESRARPNRPGWLPILAAAFATGIWFAAGNIVTPTPAPAWFFPPLLLATVLATCLGTRGHATMAGVLFALVFAGAGLHRGASLPKPPEACVGCPAPSGVEAGRLPGTVAQPDQAGPDAGPGPSAGPPRPCAEKLRDLGLHPPGPRHPALLDVEGVVSDGPVFYEGRGRVTLTVVRARQTSWISTPAWSISLFLPGHLRPLPGDRLRASVALDDLGIDLPGARDRRDRLLRQGIVCSGRIERGRIAAMAAEGGLRATIERVRRLLIQRLEDRMEPGPAAALVVALSVGDREAISDEQNQRFKASGLAHVLSVSGLHLGITVLGFHWLLSLALSLIPVLAERDPRRIAAWLSLPAAPAYAALTGASPPVLRAAIGASLYLIATGLYRAPGGWSALGAAALVLLVWSPGMLLDPSFQLSFSTCVGLLALSPGLRAAVPIAPPGPDASRPMRWAELPIAAFVTSAAASLATLPLLAAHFGEISLASLPANVVSGPVGAGATVAASLCSVVGLLAPTLLPPFLYVATRLSHLLDELARWFADLPLATIPWVAPSPLEIALLVALCLMAVVAERSRRVAALGTLLVCLALWWGRLAPPADGLLHVEFLPVGQGDCTLLRLPDGQAILVDAGGEVRDEIDVAATRVLPQLRARRIRSLAAVAISHLHPDHVGGVPGVLDQLPVGEVWTTGRPLEGRFGKPLAEALERNGIPRRILARGHPPLEIGGVTIEILGPPDVDGVSDDPLFGANDASLVLRIVHGDVAILLTGDVEADGEQALIDSGVPLGAQLIKAPHHGSRTSSSPGLLEKVRPEHVVFCVGHRNQFGFPHEAVVARYTQMGCRHHRTDRGPVHFTSDGRSLRHIP